MLLWYFLVHTAEWSQVLSTLATLSHSDHRKKVVKSNGLLNSTGSKAGKERGGWRLSLAGVLPGLLQDTNTEGWECPEKSNRVTQPLVGSTGHYLRVPSSHVVAPSLPHSSSGLDLSFIFHKACSLAKWL